MGRHTRLRARQTRPRPTPVTSWYVVHPAVYATARELAAGDPRRIRVRSYTDVLVVNGPERRR